MSYINTEWVTESYIIRDLDSPDYVSEQLPKVQYMVDIHIERVCRESQVAIDDIPTDDVTEYVNTAMLIEYGTAYLTLSIAQNLNEPSSPNNDVYDGIVKEYKEIVKGLYDGLTKYTILDIDPNEPIPVTQSIRFIPLIGQVYGL